MKIVSFAFCLELNVRAFSQMMCHGEFCSQQSFSNLMSRQRS